MRAFIFLHVRLYKTIIKVKKTIRLSRGGHKKRWNGNTTIHEGLFLLELLKPAPTLPPRKALEIINFA